MVDLVFVTEFNDIYLKYIKMAFVTNVDDDDPTILSEVNVNITFLT